MTYTLAIDPSVNNLGFAVFKDKRLEEYGLLNPTKRTLNYLDKAREMTNSIEEIAGQFDDLRKVQIVIEVPQIFGGEKAHLARESGDIIKLTFVCGMIYSLNQKTVAYTPTQWKNQLPKCVVRNRMSLHKQYIKLPLFKKTKKYCTNCKKDHLEHDMDHNILDAIAIGHFHLFGRV